MERVSAYWPAIVSAVKPLLLNLLGKASGDLLAMTLETLRRGAKEAGGLLYDLAPGLKRGRLLGNLNVAVQRNALTLLAQLLPDLLDDRNGAQDLQNRASNSLQCCRLRCGSVGPVCLPQHGLPKLT